MIAWIESMAAILGILGALLLALNCRWSSWAFVVWLASNALWIAFGLLGGHWGVVAQNVAFSITSLIGIYVWLIKPRRTARVNYTP